ncbi:hypothetical protein ABOM_007376 [Aspergillus bombycis]|uniref:C2H2 type zinc finger domain protein n=1 Tax=Aspergillus bombycis TaxID=109264 RepID=A0A1F7ZZ20_9EURO|nr:hypothetical protein ABOM_007376 [Aspergillus bombycis]OGM44706.1 hypothetical protein ABOM_007376 [Aspergillus bombycis]
MANLSDKSSLYPQHNDPNIHSPPNSSELSALPRGYNCGVCSASFRRREHFERHLSSHSKRKDFRCDICNKRFTRRDTLQRHLALHGQVSTTAHTTLPRALHACINCVKLKQRCSGSRPCDRCSRKGLPCQFPTASRIQTQEVRPNATEQNTSNQTNHTLGHNDPFRSSSVYGLSPVRTIQTDPSGSSMVDFAGGPSADILSPRQAQENSQYTDTTSLFDPFLFWPLDNAFEHPGMASTTSSGLHTSSGMAGTGNLPISMSLGSDYPAELPNSQDHSVHAEEGARDPYNAQSGNYVSDPLTQEDRDILISEDYGHVPKPSISTYQKICANYADESRSSPEALPQSLYSLQVLHTCTQLYFEHFHRGFPILHQGSFQARSSSWLLYIAVAAVGSQYSRLPGRTRIFFDLVKIIRVSLLQKLNSIVSLQNNLELAQATLLFNFALLFGGTREGIMHLQYQRNLLVTMCRPFLVPCVLFAKNDMLSSASVPTTDWHQWITIESWKRVVYFTWLTECFQTILFDLPSIITLGDMHLRLPCNDQMWQSTTFHDWERARSLQRDPTELLHPFSLLKVRAVDDERIRRLSDLELWISVIAVYLAERHITEQQSLYSSFGMHKMPDYRNLLSGEGIDEHTHDRDNIDAVLEAFEQAVTRRRQEPPLLPIVTKFSLLLRLIRFIHYRQLYASVGWMARPPEVFAATQHITQRLQTEPRRARQSLSHAARLFQIIRSQRQFDPYDSFMLLMAVLYIWNYDRLVISGQPPRLAGGDSEEILRIDQDMNEEVRKKWIAGTFDLSKHLHISGIGVLNGQSSQPRIFRESIRVLGHDQAWSTQANAIRSALHQILSGGAPSFPAQDEG